MITVCNELYTPQLQPDGVLGIEQPNPVDLQKYERLQREGQNIIRNNFLSASEHLENTLIKSAFDDTWKAFNGWGMVITGADTDAGMIKSLAIDANINADFENFLQNVNPGLREKIMTFFKSMPIFDAGELNKLHLFRNSKDDRNELVQHFYTTLKNHYDTTLTLPDNEKKLKKSFSPKCWKRHFDNGEEIPLDWQHFIKATYQVRCNAFHGSKDIEFEPNFLIMESAFLTLFHFLKTTDYLKLES